jgi:hypothetical protein
MKRATLLVFLGLAISIGACGGSDGGRSPKAAADSPPEVIRAWSDTLRAGKVDQAASYFEIPSVVENGTGPVTLRSRVEARGFNVALPCGAKLLRTSSAGKFTTAVFRLTDRPGPGGGCGSGAGSTARTTFVIAEGKIKQWRRVSDRPRPTGPIV